ncbi:UNVERIFIED_CONTAM: hypothetical protein HDU68_003118 [Siphonaria sp. JEL0065]|nr:hypothetical protein HDU68_003118 [Siphonaria sp. JEL0065]
MQAAEQTDTIKEDPILNVFRTFAGLHGVASHPLLNFADPNDLAEAIIDAAKHSLVNMIIIPQSAAKASETPTTPTGEQSRVSKYQSSWIGEDATQTTRHVAQDVWNALSSVSVIHFIDRGFMSLNVRGADHGSRPVSQAIPSAQSIFQQNPVDPSPLSGKARPPKPARLNTGLGPIIVNVVVLVAGLADACEAEAIRLVQHITGSSSVSQTVVFNTHILKLLPTSEEVAQDTSLVSDSTNHSVKNATEIQMDTSNLFAITSRIDSLVRHHEDLVVVGESVLKQNAEFFVEGQRQPGLEHWLEYDCSATIAIVHGRK